MLSWISAYSELHETRCHEWDDRELDVLEGFKFIGFVMLQLMSTTLFFNGAPQYNIWKMLDFLQQMFFTVIISCNMGTDIFLALSAFIGAYKCLQIYDANGGSISGKDAGKMYLRKFVRLAPMVYFVFFLGWVITPRLRDAPTWVATNQLFYKCDQYWWAQVLFIGNLVPWFEEATCGCFYWAWGFYVDL